jgi:hypothetical protein
MELRHLAVACLASGLAGGVAFAIFGVPLNPGPNPPAETWRAVAHLSFGLMAIGVFLAALDALRRRR